MSRFQTASLCGALILSVAACGGKGSGPAPAPPPPAPPTGLTVPGDGGTTQASRATLSQSGEGFILRIQDGPLRDVSVVCADPRGDQCTVLGDPSLVTGQATILAQLRGTHAYAGQFSVQGKNRPNTSQLVHSVRPGLTPGTVTLPRDVVTYNGQFRAGAGLHNGPEGMIGGTVTLAVDFDTGFVNANFNGGFPENGPAVSATIVGATIDRNTGRFATTANSNFTFNGTAGGGTLDGAFYGANAQEAAGAFTVGAQNIGGMSGVFLGCQGATGTCITD